MLTNTRAKTWCKQVEKTASVLTLITSQQLNILSKYKNKITYSYISQSLPTENTDYVLW